MTVDKGDIDLRPGHLPLGKMSVHTRSGNIEVALPQSATFALTASIDHGEIDNQFGESLKERTDGRGARLEGAIGNGPDVNLVTDRGSITVRKSSGEATPAKVATQTTPINLKAVAERAGSSGKSAILAVKTIKLNRLKDEIPLSARWSWLFGTKS